MGRGRRAGRSAPAPAAWSGGPAAPRCAGGGLHEAAECDERGDATRADHAEEDTELGGGGEGARADVDDEPGESDDGTVGDPGAGEGEAGGEGGDRDDAADDVDVDVGATTEEVQRQGGAGGADEPEKGVLDGLRGAQRLAEGDDGGTGGDEQQGDGPGRWALLQLEEVDRRAGGDVGGDHRDDGDDRAAEHVAGVADRGERPAGDGRATFGDAGD